MQYSGPLIRYEQSNTRVELPGVHEMNVELEYTLANLSDRLSSCKSASLRVCDPSRFVLFSIVLSLFVPLIVVRSLF